MARVKTTSKNAEEAKAREEAEARLKAEQEIRAKAEEEAKKKAVKKGKQPVIEKPKPKRKQPPRGVETGISIGESPKPPPVKKSKVTPKKQSKKKAVIPSSSSDSEYASDDPLGPDSGDDAPPAQKLPPVEEPEEDSDWEPVVGEIGTTGHPRKALSSVPTSFKEKHKYTSTPKPKKQSWAEFINSKGFKPKRSIKAQAFDTDDPVLRVIHRRKLGQWLVKWQGYKQGIVKKWYTLAVKEEKNDVINARMGPKKTVTLTPDLIAEFLKIERPTPEEVEYPHPNHQPKTRREAMEIVYSDPNPPKDDGNTFPIGFMRSEYATMNKIIHRNLYCRGSTPASRLDEVNLLIEFMGEAVIDIAAWIFEDICHYLAAKSARSIPFPQMITQICMDQGINSDEPFSHGEGGVTPAVSSVGPRAKAEAAKATQASGGLRSKIASASKVPQATSPLTSSLRDVIASMHENINRVLRRQEIQWEIQMIQHAWSHSIYEKFGVDPMPPIPAEYLAEFMPIVPSEPPSTPVTPAASRPSTSAPPSAEPSAKSSGRKKKTVEVEEEKIGEEEEETEPEDFFDI